MLKLVNHTETPAVYSWGGFRPARLMPDGDAMSRRCSIEITPHTGTLARYVWARRMSVRKNSACSVLGFREFSFFVLSPHPLPSPPRYDREASSFQGDGAGEQEIELTVHATNTGPLDFVARCNVEKGPVPAKMLRVVGSVAGPTIQIDAPEVRAHAGDAPRPKRSAAFSVRNSMLTFGYVVRPSPVRIMSQRERRIRRSLRSKLALSSPCRWTSTL